MRAIYTILLLLAFAILKGQNIPDVYKNIKYSDKGILMLSFNDSLYPAQDATPRFTINDNRDIVSGTANGLAFVWTDTTFKGKMYFGFIHYNDSKHPLPVYFKQALEIDNGYAHIDIKNQLRERYDMIGWETSGRGVIGYRIQDIQGNMIYEGRVAFKGKGPFQVANTLTEGPFVDQITEKSAIISYKTSEPVKARVKVGTKIYQSKNKNTHHEVFVDQLVPESEYVYQIEIDSILQQYRFKTAPKPGKRTAFTFAYASDSRSGQGGGERSMYGTNMYIMKKIMALANQQNATFLQFTGDFIDGYSNSSQDMNLQYSNWKKSIEPWANSIPVYEGMGNHEALVHHFVLEQGKWGIMINKFPFETESSEVIFNQNFVNPENGPLSEDGASYDPNPDKTDFPPYIENVYHYSYDNVAIVVLNSDYLYTPRHSAIPITGGNLHAYIMDMQLNWLKKVILEYESNEHIDHIFVTQHTPAFPNGGHVGDDMWYNGNNQYRPWIAGKPLPKGIIERRDEYLDILVNQSEKVVGILTGDEHNYCRTLITPEMPRYPDSGYYAKKITLNRTIHQINNGAAGAPYYAQQQTPWTDFVSGFTTQNALVLIHVEGQKVELEVLNPDTLEEIDRLVLRE